MSLTFNHNNKLFVNDSNVGVGTTDPLGLLMLRKDQTAPTRLIISNEGTVNASTSARLSFYEGIAEKHYIERRRDGSGKLAFVAPANDNPFVWENTSGEFMRFTDSNVGIGTVTPSKKLHIKGELGIERSSTTAVNTINSEGNFKFIASTGYAMTFVSQGSEMVRFYDGNVGIGNTALSARLHIGDGTADGLLFYSQGQYSTTKFYGVSNQTGSGVWEFKNTGTWNQTRFYIEDANHSSSRLTLDIKGNGGAVDILAATSHGYVGIGTTEPSQKLHVIGAANTSPIIQVESVSNNYSARMVMKTPTREWRIGTYSGQNDNFWIYDPTANSYRFVIDTSGNVGIGTTSPSNTLDINGGLEVNAEAYIRSTSNVGLRIQTTDQGITSTDGLRVGLNATHAFVWQYENLPLSFGTNGSQKATILANGNFGIGVTSPDSPLHVSGDIKTSSRYLVSTGTSGEELGMGFWDGTTTRIEGGSAKPLFITSYEGNINLGISNGTTMTVKSSSVGIGTTSPSGKLHVYGGRILLDNLAAQQSAIQFNSAGSEKTVIYRPGSSNDLRIYKAGISNDALTILDSSGNVGIGTSNPVGLLTISASGGTGLEIHAQDSLARMALVSYDRADSAYREIYFEGYNFNFNTSGANTRLSILNNGKVGIGTTSPAHKLDVDGGAKFNTNTGTTPFYVTRLGNTNEALSISVMDNTVRFESIQDETADDYGGFDFRLDAGTTHPNFTIRKGSADPILHVDGGGNVGIGVTNPSEKLHVAGNITTSGISSISAAYNSSNFMKIEGNTSGGTLVGYDGGVHTTMIRSYGDSFLNGGNLGIGTTSPSTELDVAGDISADGVITTGGTATAEVGSWLHVGRQWSFSGLPYFNKTTGSTAQRLDGAFMTDLNTGAASYRRAQAVFGAAFNDISGYSGAGTDYSRALGASIKAGFFITGQNAAKVIFAVGLASTSGVYADADPISNYGFGVEFRRGSGSVYEWRVFGHNGTSLTASSWSSSGITYSTDPRTIAIYSDGSGNITAYTAMYGNTNYTTITTTGGPTATSGTSTSTNMVGLRCNTASSSEYVTGAYSKARASAVNFYAE